MGHVLSNTATQATLVQKMAEELLVSSSLGVGDHS